MALGFACYGAVLLRVGAAPRPLASSRCGDGGTSSGPRPASCCCSCSSAGVLLYPSMDSTYAGRAAFSLFGLLVLALTVLALRATPFLTWVAVTAAVPSALAARGHRVQRPRAALRLVGRLRDGHLLLRRGQHARLGMLRDDEVTTDELFAVPGRVHAARVGVRLPVRRSSRRSTPAPSAPPGSSDRTWMDLLFAVLHRPVPARACRDDRRAGLRPSPAASSMTRARSSASSTSRLVRWPGRSGGAELSPARPRARGARCRGRSGLGSPAGRRPRVGPVRPRVRHAGRLPSGGGRGALRPRPARCAPRVLAAVAVGGAAGALLRYAAVHRAPRLRRGVPVDDLRRQRGGVLRCWPCCPRPRSCTVARCCRRCSAPACSAGSPPCRRTPSRPAPWSPAGHVALAAAYVVGTLAACLLAVAVADRFETSRARAGSSTTKRATSDAGCSSRSARRSGAPLRYVAGRLLDGRLPRGTILVNWVGSFLLGWFTGLGLTGDAAGAARHRLLRRADDVLLVRGADPRPRACGSGPLAVVLTVVPALLLCGLGFAARRLMPSAVPRVLPGGRRRRTG